MPLKIDQNVNIRIRTNQKTDPDRNLQLNDGEIQLEANKGALSVYAYPDGLGTIRITAVRGYEGKANSAFLNAMQLDAFIDMLIGVRTELQKSCHEK